MTDAAKKPLKILDTGTAAVCTGDSCQVPDHGSQAEVNRLLDEDAV